MPKPTCTECKTARSTTGDGLCNACRQAVAEARKPKPLPLGMIRTDAGTQTRVKLDEARVAEYVERMIEGDEFPAIVVYYDGATYFLADGFHRYFAHKRAERAEILCEVRQGTRRDALYYACGANAKHPLSLTNADKRKAVAILLGDEEWSQMTDRDIAAKCGCGRTLVQRMRLEQKGEPWVHPAYRKEEAATGEGGLKADSDASEDAPEQAGGGSQGGLKAEPEPEPEEPAPAIDAVGIPLESEEIVERFRALERGREARSLCRKLGAILNDICANPGGEHLGVEMKRKHKPGTHDEITYRSHLLEQLLRQLDQHLPHAAVCPWCHSTGDAACTACRGLGYVTKQLWQQAPEENRQKALRDLAVRAVEEPQPEDEAA